MNQKIKSFISLKATSAMFGLLFFVALAGGMAINVPMVSATVIVNTQPVADFTSGTYKADAVFSVVKFGIIQTEAETLSSVAVTIVAEGTATSGDFASLEVYKEDGTTVGFQLGEDDTLVGTQATVNVGSATTISIGDTAIGDTETTFYVVATLAASPTDTNAFSVDMAADGIATSANSPTVTVLDGSATAIATIDTAPTVAITYSSDPAKAGAMTITATYSEAIVGTPAISINQSGSTDISAVNMTSSDQIIWTYSYTVVAADGSTYIDGTAIVSLSTVADAASNNAASPTNTTFTIDTTAPVMISATYKDTDDDGTVDSIDVTYSEDITGSTFVDSEWSFPTNLYGLAILPGNSTISATNIHIAIDPDNSVNINDTTINDTKVGYIATTVNGGIIDGANNYAEDQELRVCAEGDEDDIPIPDYGHLKPKQPNPNSGVTLYRVDGDPRVYVIKNKKKRWIQTPKEFNDAGYNWGKVKVVSAETLEEYPDDGETSTTELLRAVGSHKVYKINNGKRRWIETAGEFNAAGYKWKDIKDVSPEVLASYQNEVSSGLLRATGSHKVYIIENGKKRWIKTAGEFNAAGHRWGDVEDVSVVTLDSYSDLETLE